MACKRSRVRFSSSPLTENAFGFMSRAFFDGVRELRISGLTRSGPYSDPLCVGKGFERQVNRSVIAEMITVPILTS